MSIVQKNLGSNDTMKIKLTNLTSFVFWSPLETYPLLVIPKTIDGQHKTHETYFFTLKDMPP